MKKLFFFCSLLLMAIAGVSAKAETKTDSGEFTLKDAYDEIAKLPHMKVAAQPDSLWLHVSSEYVDSLESVRAMNLGREDVYNNGKEIFGILDRVGLQSLIVGGSNQYMVGLVYAKPLQDGRCELLTFGACGEYGFMAVWYGISDKATVNTIQRSHLSLDINHIVVAIDENVDIINLSVGN